MWPNPQFPADLRIWLHLLKKSLMKNFIFCVVSIMQQQYSEFSSIRIKTTWRSFCFYRVSFRNATCLDANVCLLMVNPIQSLLPELLSRLCFSSFVLNIRTSFLTFVCRASGHLYKNNKKMKEPYEKTQENCSQKK